ncbi:MAG: tetratricopeptide repeat protein [Gammaproteobacteria bacterium]|nr:tetratricopeptide repeat protein [Gammaproteobacteria bacterium]
MNKHIVKRKWVSLVAVFAVACVLFTSNSFAVKVTETLSQPVYEKLEQVEDAIDAKAYDQALKIVREMRSNFKLTQYEASQVWNIEAYIYYLKEDYKKAIATYNEVLKYGNLAEAVIQSTLKTVAQLHFIREEYKPAIAAASRLIARLDSPDVSLYMLQGQAYYQLKEYDKALTPITSAINADKSIGKIPKENTLLLLRAIYYEKKDFKNMVLVLKEVIQHYPKDSYLYTLAAIYSELGQTKKQMALTEVLFEKGYIKGEKHAINLANLYLLHNLPYKAAQLLQREVDNKRVQANERNLRLLSQAWYQAREDKKAIPPMQLAAEQSEKGELYIRLAQSYLNLEQWSKAVKAIEQGLKKGGIKKPDTANIMLGTALFNLKELGKARKAFTTVAASKVKNNSRTAKTWLAFLDSEIRRSKLEQESAPEFERSLEAQENIEELS